MRVFNGQNSFFGAIWGGLSANGEQKRHFQRLNRRGYVRCDKKDVSEVPAIKSASINAAPPRPSVVVVAAPSPDRRDAGCPMCKAGVADGRQCRIWLNEAQREIDRLRSSLASPPERCDSFEKQPSEATDSTRRIYAPSAIGDVSQMNWREQPPPPPQPAAPALHHFHITNVGSLLDVLA